MAASARKKFRAAPTGHGSELQFGCLPTRRTHILVSEKQITAGLVNPPWDQPSGTNSFCGTSAPQGLASAELSCDPQGLFVRTQLATDTAGRAGDILWHHEQTGSNLQREVGCPLQRHSSEQQCPGLGFIGTGKIFHICCTYSKRDDSFVTNAQSFQRRTAWRVALETAVSNVLPDDWVSYHSRHLPEG